jgi:tetratricopeptide (TPR) repeat protein
MRIWRSAIALFPVCGLLLAAAAPLESDAEDLIRRANAAFERDDLAEAERLYQSAEVLTNDPGLVAFNRAAVLFHRAQAAQPDLYAEAAKYFSWALNDAACPPERAARAWYNRGTCLMRQPGATATVYRSSIACLERCLDSASADPPLRANAAYNLKLAKLLWNEARKREKKEDNPNRDLPAEDPRSENPPESPMGIDPRAMSPETGDGTAGVESSRVLGQHAATATMKGAQGLSPMPAATGQLRPFDDLGDARSLTPEETREKLRRTAERLRRDQQIMRTTLYGSERPGLHDW